MNPVEGEEENELRSRHSMERVYVRLHNRTGRTVDVIWINYTGDYVKYKTLFPGQHVDINTFVTHPWLFLDAKSRDRMQVERKDVFYPTPVYVYNQEERQLARCQTIVTLPLYSLRRATLNVVRNLVRNEENVNALELPVSVKRDLIQAIEDQRNSTAVPILAI